MNNRPPRNGAGTEAVVEMVAAGAADAKTCSGAGAGTSGSGIGSGAG